MCIFMVILEHKFDFDKEGDYMGKLRGSMDTLSSMQLTENMEGLDAQSKLILHSKEVLAIILQEVISEYRG